MQCWDYGLIKALNDVSKLNIVPMYFVEKCGIGFDLDKIVKSTDSRVMADFHLTIRHDPAHYDMAVHSITVLQKCCESNLSLHNATQNIGSAMIKIHSIKKHASDIVVSFKGILSLTPIYSD